MQTYSEIARAILRLLVSLHHLSLLDGNAAIEELVFGLAGALVRVQQSGMISDIVRFGSEQVLEHIRPTCVGSKLHRRCWPGRTPFPVRQVVSTSEQHTRVIDLTTGRAGPDYLPCLKTMVDCLPVQRDFPHWQPRCRACLGHIAHCDLRGQSFSRSWCFDRSGDLHRAKHVSWTRLHLF
jgi:hypothetical protein